MMSTNNESSTMENSTILREIADLDIKAPISVTISFDDDFDEALIKKEIVSDDYQEEETEDTVVSSFFPLVEPKTETQTQELDSCLLTEKQSDTLTTQYNHQEPTDPQTDNFKDTLLNSDTPRKRKADNLQMCKPKQVKALNDDTNNANNSNSKNSPVSLTNHTIRNNVQSNPNLSTSERENNISVATTSTTVDSIKEAATTQSDLSLHGLDQSEKDKIRSCVVNSLASLSESMRRVLQAYSAHKHQHISSDDFRKLKKQYFNLSYKALVTIVLPEENNIGFVTTFLKDTLQRARKQCGPYYMHTHKDYANLLHEMVMWAKQTQKPIQSAHIFANSNEHSRPPVEAEANTNPTLEKLLVNNPNSNTASDTICIFSSGPPERALSINIDLNLKKYLQDTQNCSKATNQSSHDNTTNETNENRSQDSTNKNSTTQLHTAVEYLQRFVINSNPSATVHNRPPVIQSTISQNSHPATAEIEQRALPSSNTQLCSTSTSSNYSILTHKKAPTPVLQNELEKPPLLGYLQQQQLIEPRRPSPSYDRALHFQTQSKQVQQSTQPYHQSRRINAPLNQQQIQYYQAQLLQAQSNALQSHSAQLVQVQSNGLQSHSEQLVQAQSKALQSNSAQLVQAQSNALQSQQSHSAQLVQAQSNALQSHSAQLVQAQSNALQSQQSYSAQLVQAQSNALQSHSAQVLQPLSNSQQSHSAQVLQTQLNALQSQHSQYFQTQSRLQYGQTWQSQGHLSQSQIPQCNHPRRTQAGLLQQDQYQQLLHNPTESWPTVEELLSTATTPQLPYQSSNECSRSSGRGELTQHPQQAQPLQAYGTEWHQGQIYQAQGPPQGLKGSPRSASTDSGFISPLNFNASTEQTRAEQTMATTPREDSSDTSMPMIVHVTSLSDKAAFVDMGKCGVCQKSTKQMCMGCMKIYYCNFQCQTLDWATHAPHCSHQNTIF